jgi:Tfp pilus assembly protein PilO
VNRRILLATSAAVVLLVAAWYTVLWKPATSSLHRAQAAAATGEARLQSLTFRVASLRTEDRRLPAEERKLSALEASVPGSLEVPQVIKELAGVASRSGVQISAETQTVVASTPAASATSSAPSSPLVGLQQLQLSLTVKGSYGQVMGFLQGLGALPRATITQNVQISASSASLVATVQAVVFYDATPPPRVPVRP